MFVFFQLATRRELGAFEKNRMRPANLSTNWSLFWLAGFLLHNAEKQTLASLLSSRSRESRIGLLVRRRLDQMRLPNANFDGLTCFARNAARGSCVGDRREIRWNCA